MDYGQSEFIELVNGKLHCLRMGAGKRVLLAVHGYGNTAAIFSSFQRYLEGHFTIFSIDLPHHGKSEWSEDSLLHKVDLEKLVAFIMADMQVNKVSVLGYSMGGRVCMGIIELMPEKVEQMILLASDGLVFNPFYYFATRTMVGRSLFRNFLKNNGPYRTLIEWLRRRQLIAEARYKFGMRYIGTPEDRSFLGRAWPAMSMIIPNTRKLKAVINKYNIPVCIFMGEHDRVIPLQHAKKFQQGLSTVKLHVLDKGHRVFDADTIPQISNSLISGKC